MITWIGLGSNIGVLPKVAPNGIATSFSPSDRIEQAIASIAAWPDQEFLGASSLYRTEAVVHPDNPEKQDDYCNAVVAVDSLLPATTLLDHAQSLENQHQRARNGKWGARTLDVDLLLYGAAKISSERLTIPHPLMHERRFVLEPLQELAGQLQIQVEIPDIGSAQDHLHGLSQQVVTLW